MRWILLVVALPCFLAAQSPAEAPPEPPVPFEQWLRELIDEADDKGFDDTLIANTLAGLEPLPRVIQADRSQAELNPGLDRYLSTRLTRAVISRGREMMRQHRTVLARIEREFKVQRRFVVAIWGMETRYGRIMGREPIFRAP
jgi:membrane-bound lytic murein transglycosylase B